MKRGESKWQALFTVCCAAPLLVLLLVGLAFPQASFFQGKNVTIIQASAPGGVGDMRTKALVPFLHKYIPGNPTIVMEYMPGGGGRKAANHFHRTVRPDGLAIGRMNSTYVMHSILGETGVLYDIDKGSYLGTTYSGGYHVFITRRDAKLDTLEKLRAATGVRIGAQEVGHLIYVSARMFALLIGLKQPRFVTGYSSPELDVAIEQGEIDGRSTVADSMLHEKAHWADKKLMDFHALIEVPKGRKHTHPRLAELPDIQSFARSDLDHKLVTLYRTFIGSGNPLILPPGTPKERVQILQDAMRKIFNDPEFHREYTKLTGLKAEPQMPEELEQTVRDMPRDREAVELFKKITGPDPLPQR